MRGDRLSVSSGSHHEPVIGFSRAVRMGNVVAVSGTAPIGPGRETVGKGDPAAQARRCFEIIGAALSEAGAGFEDVIRTRCYLVDIAHWETIGRVHGEVFDGFRPASTMVQVARLIEADWLLEIEADAVLPPNAARVWPA